MPKSRTRRNFRQRKPKQEKPIFVIATEGEITEYIYFYEFKKKLKDKIIIHILPTGRDGNSAPKQVVKRIENFIRKRVSTRRKKDEFWAVIDFDNWGEAQILEAYNECQENKYKLAVSNPCFELWLNLHQDNPKIPKVCSACKSELRKLLKSYDKNKYDVDKLLEKLDKALEKSAQLHLDKDELFPKDTGTHVYLLVKKLAGQI